MDGLDSIKHVNGKMLIKILCLNKNRKWVIHELTLSYGKEYVLNSDVIVES